MHRGDRCFRTTEVRRGDVRILVSTTGTIAADGAVDVGTEVSGTVEAVLVDFNDQVIKGQVLAKLKTDLLDAALHDANAALSRAAAEYGQAFREYSRGKALYDNGYIAENEFLSLKTANDVTSANLLSARAAVDRAETNVEKATIRSPIEGMVLERDIEEGQTVAASFNTPTLFVIVCDPSRIKIDALVDETDIGRIREGQQATFAVSAYPDSCFGGTVTQIRRKPVVSQNVVNYTVVLAAQNPDTLLLPGMTATIDFVINRVTDTLVLSNEAFAFHPEPGIIRKTHAGGKPIAFPAGTGVPIWALDGKGDVFPLLVSTGLANESETVIGGGVRAGMRIITALATGNDTVKSAKSSDVRSRPMPPPMF